MEQNNKNTALLVMDMQAGIFGILPNATDLLPKVTQAIASAREKKIPIIYITVGFRQGGELTVMKRRLSAFSGSDLDLVLRAFGIQHMVLTGISTSGVVLSTLREATDKDYRLTVLSDCCADGDEEVHRVLTTKIFPRHADVLMVDDWKKI